MARNYTVVESYSAEFRHVAPFNTAKRWQPVRLDNMRIMPYTPRTIVRDMVGNGVAGNDQWREINVNEPFLHATSHDGLTIDRVLILPSRGPSSLGTLFVLGDRRSQPLHVRERIFGY